jgi:hypothetical protein
MLNTGLKVRSAHDSSAALIIGLDIRSSVQAARGQPSSSTMLTPVDTIHHHCAEVVGADKRWVGSLVCLATALASTSLLLWLTLIIAG